MNITVCIKQVPSINNLSIDPVNYTLVREDANQIINPSDESALETALLINDAVSSRITVLSMGRQSAASILMDTLNLGAERAFLINDKKYAGSDTCVTATILSRAIEYTGKSDLVICGSRSSDGETGQVGPELAVALNVQCITNVVSVIEANENFLKIKKQTDNGYDILQVNLPALICINENSFRLRPFGIKNMQNAKFKKVSILDNSVLKLEEKLLGLKGSPTKVTKIYTRKFENKTGCIQSDGTKARNRLIELIVENLKPNIIRK